MICDFGDVAVVPFPFVDLAISKYRPSLVLSNRTFNEDNGNTLLAMITTAQRSAWPSDVRIVDSDSAGLAHQSYIRWKIFTLPNELLLRVAGHFGEADKATVRTALTGILR